MLIFAIATTIIERVVDSSPLNQTNRRIGAVGGAIRGALIVYVIYWALLLFPVITMPNWVKVSTTYSILEKITKAKN